MAKHKCPEFENHERWLVSYADMVTLLFAVFVVLYALKDDGEKATDAAGSLEEAFNKPLEDIPPHDRIGPTELGFGIFEHLKGNTNRPPVSKKFPTDHNQARIIDTEMNQVKMDLEERLYGPAKFRKKTEPGLARIISVVKTDHGFRLRLTARHFYGQGEVDVRAAALPDLDKIIKVLKELGRPVTIEGHTDSLPPRGSNNWDLSTLRATRIVRRMIRKFNYPPSNLTATGYADTRPMSSNQTAKGRNLNRRIEIRVEYNEDNAPAGSPP